MSTTSSPTEARDAGKEKTMNIFPTRYWKRAVGSRLAVVGEEVKVKKSY